MYTRLIPKPLSTSTITLTSASREKRCVMYHCVGLSLATCNPSSRKGSPPIQNPVQAS